MEGVNCVFNEPVRETGWVCYESIIGVSLHLPSDKHWMNFVYCLWESIVSDGARKIRGKPYNDTMK